MKYLYGPVPSRRLGISLGVDIVPAKTCSYDCVYCQLGRTTNKTVDREEYVSADVVCQELEGYLSGSPPLLDYITFSGSGEPTLNSKIGKMIKEVKRLTSIKVVVLTNSSLLWQTEVQKDLAQADLVLPSLDAVTSEVFQVINRPCPSLKIKKIIEGIISFRRAYKGKMWLEVLLCRGINDSQAELRKMKKAVEGIKPDKVDLNTVTRPPSEVLAQPLNKEQLKEAQKIIGRNSEIVRDFRGAAYKESSTHIEEEILGLLKRRPCTVTNICHGLGINPNQVIKCMDALFRAGKVDYQVRGENIYYYLAKVF